MTNAALLDQVGAEAASNPMTQGSRILHNDRIILLDGDALAYSVAGNDSTPIGTARHNLLDRIATATAAAGAWGTKVLLTAPSSNKGFRFAVARRKPYQGHRNGSRKPKNWEGLRRMLEEGDIPNVDMTTTAEADDLFGKYASELGPKNVVHYTADKDMRMLPGWHMNWDTFSMHYVPEGTWDIQYDGKTFGRKWFWLQMLHGDSADNIPGLPNLYPDNRRSGLVGPATAEKMLAPALGEALAIDIVTEAYQGYYGDEWSTELLEQGVLLWMRRDRFSAWHDVMMDGNPLAALNTAGKWTGIDTMRQRIKGTL